MIKSFSLTALSFGYYSQSIPKGLIRFLKLFFVYKINFYPVNSTLLIPSSGEAMAPHFSTLAWKIPWMEETGGLQSMGSHRVGHDWSDLAAAATPSSLIYLFIFFKWGQLKKLIHNTFVFWHFLFLCLSPFRWIFLFYRACPK